MGVRQTHYVMLGVKFPFSDLTEDQREILYNATSNKDTLIRAVVDAMGGEYIVLGQILSQGEDDMGLEFLSFETQHLMTAAHTLAPHLHAFCKINHLPDQICLKSQVQLHVFTQFA